MTFAFLENILYIIEIVLGISFIIFIHELGHFLIAKWRKVRCETFALGFGPKVISWIPKYPWKPNDKNFKYKDVVKAEMMDSQEDLEWLVRTKRLRIRKYNLSQLTEGMVAVVFNDEEEGNEKLGAKLITKEMLKEWKDKGENRIYIYDAAETEYAIRLFWVGGYVKMAGELELDEEKKTLKDEFLNKGPGSRAMVIVAGVTFNAISAFILFIIAFGMGVPSVYPGIGGIQPVMTSNGKQVATPAWESGLRAGDKVKKIGDEDITEFTDLQVGVAFASADKELDIEVERPGYDEPLHFKIKPKYNDTMGFASLGIEPVTSTRVGAIMESRKGSLKGTIKVKGQPDKPGELLEGDIIIGVKDKKSKVNDGVREIIPRKPNEQEDLNMPRMRSYASLRELLNKIEGDEVTLKIIRNGEIFDLAGIKLFNRYQAVSFGLDMYPNVPIKSVKKGGPADTTRSATLVDGEWVEGETAPIKPGDKIVEVNGVAITSFEQLRREIRKLTAGEQALIKVQRKEHQAVESLFVTPSADTTTGAAQLEFLPEIGDENEEKFNNDLTVKGVNEIAKFKILSTIGKDLTESERKAINHRILPGDKILEINKKIVKSWNKTSAEDTYDVNSLAFNTWKNNENNDVIPECTPVEIKVLRKIIGEDGKEKEVTITYNTTAFTPDLYLFKNLVGFSPTQGYIDVTYPFGEAIVMGLQKTWIFAKMVVMTIKSVVSADISAKNIGGPILIAQTSYKIAKLGLGKFIYFMALLSINLAILNILPIPVFDGGALLFILIEVIRGKKLSDRIMGFFNIIGLVFIGLLIILVLYNDLARLFGF